MYAGGGCGNTSEHEDTEGEKKEKQADAGDVTAEGQRLALVEDRIVVLTPRALAS